MARLGSNVGGCQLLDDACETKLGRSGLCEGVGRAEQPLRRLSCFGANATLALERPLRFEHIAGEAVGVMPGRFQVPDGPLQVRAGYGARAEAEHKRVIGLSGRAKEWVRFSLDALSVPAHAWPLPTYGLALAVGLIGAWVAVVLLACGAICVRRAARDYAMASATPIKL